MRMRMPVEVEDASTAKSPPLPSSPPLRGEKPSPSSPLPVERRLRTLPPQSASASTQKGVLDSTATHAAATLASGGYGNAAVNAAVNAAAAATAGRGSGSHVALTDRWARLANWREELATSSSSSDDDDDDGNGDAGTAARERDRIDGDARTGSARGGASTSVELTNVVGQVEGSSGTDCKHTHAEKPRLEWACPCCTFVNLPTASACEICGACPSQ